MNLGIKRITEGFFDENNERYKMLFSFENAYGIFRRLEEGEEARDESFNYQLIDYNTHQCIIIEDVLKDIIFMMRSGYTEISINDVICIKINGAVVSYRFCGMKNYNPEYFSKNFIELPGFLDEEINFYVSELRKEKKLLNVLDGKVYLLDEINLKKYVICCIDKEVFQSSNSSAGVFSDYSIYTLKDLRIKPLKPYSQPFKMMKNVLYYLNKSKKNNDALILLMNRSELEFVKDYYQLKQLVI